jgi:exopolysaccharide production protein ExoZ
MKTRSDSRQKLPGLQSIRAVAALLVLLVHVTQEAHARLNYSFLAGTFKFGTVGLDLFFVVSGFIIFFIHSDDWGQPSRFVPYIKKRLIRIYPIYWVVVSGVIAMAFIIPKSVSDQERGWEYILKSFFLIPQRELPILGVAWTLSYEMFFYLVFGLLILVRQPLVRWVAVLWIAGSFLVSLCAPRTESFTIIFIFSHFNLEFAAGVLVAYLIQKGVRAPGGVILVLGLILFVVSIFIPRGFGGLLPDQLVRVLTFGPGCALIVWGGVLLDLNRAQQSWVNRLLAVPGDASYSIYLVHHPTLAFLFATFGRHLAGLISTFGTCVVFMIIALAAGIAVHFFIEKPVLRLMHRWFLAPKAVVVGKGGQSTQSSQRANENPSSV